LQQQTALADIQEKATVAAIEKIDVAHFVYFCAGVVAAFRSSRQTEGMLNGIHHIAPTLSGDEAR
jgi:hypothetical protein